MKKILSIFICFVMIISFAVSVSAFKVITVKSIVLDKGSLTLNPLQTYSLKITLKPANTTQKSLTYATSNKSIATVDSKGKITAVKAGKATITVASSINKKISAKCNVTVVNKQRIKFVYVMQDRAAKASGDDEVLKYINEKFNCDYVKINIPADQINEKMSIMIASGDQMDAFYGVLATPGNPRDLNSLIDGGLIQPLNSLLNQNGKNLLKEIPADVWKYATEKDGKIWFVPDMGFKSKVFLFVRQDWMKKFNISTPKTIGDFEKMLITFRDGDPDGNGKNDTYPLTAIGPIGGTAWQHYMDQGFLGSFLPNGASWFEDKNGSLVPAFMHPNYKLYLQTLQRWYKDKLLDPDYLVNKSEQVKDKITKGISGVEPNWYSLSYQDEVKTVNPNAEMTYISFPTGPTGKSGAMSQAICSGGLVISSTAKPEVAAKIIEIVDWLQTPEGTNFAWYGIEGKHWVKQGDKITPAPGIDPANPAYKAQLYINGGNAWKYFTESSLVKPELMSVTRQVAIKGQYPTIDPVDYQFTYNWDGTKTKDIMSDLEVKMPLEMYSLIVSGQKPVSYLEDFIKDWLAKGGQTYIDEKTKQYKAQKNKK